MRVYLTQQLDMKLKIFEIKNSLIETYVNELQTNLIMKHS